MPEGYSVRKRRLVTVAADGSTTKASKKDAARAGELVVSAAKAAKTAKKSRKQTKKAAKGGRRTSVTLAAGRWPPDAGRLTGQSAVRAPGLGAHGRSSLDRTTTSLSPRASWVTVGS